jgi:hypothetical protein
MSTNPYASPNSISEDENQTPGKKVPVAGIVFGILNILYGVSMLLCNGSTGLFFFIELPQSMIEANPAMELMQVNWLYKLYNQLGIVASMISGLLFIVAGVGLLQLRPFGRWLSIILCLLEYFLLVLSLVVNGIYLVPALLRQIDSLPSGSPEQYGAIGGLIGGILGAVFSAIYPSVTLFFMFRPKMIAAYAAKT